MRLREGEKMENDWILRTGILMVGILLLGGCLGNGPSAQGLTPVPNAANGTGGVNQTAASGSATAASAAGAGAVTAGADAASASAGGAVQTAPVPTVYFFYLSTCPYSRAQMKDVNPKLKAEFPQVKWEEDEVMGADARMKWYTIMGERNQTPSGVPVTIVGPDVISAYYPGETEVKLRAAIKAEIARTGKK
jgi:hypothetical protein